jgi:hypothetical protein
VAGLLSAAALGCSDDEDPDSAEQLYGTWEVGDVGFLQTFESDGSWYVVDSFSDDPFDTGTSTFDGSIVTFDTDEDSGTSPQTTGSYEVTFSDPDAMSLELIDDQCLGRGSKSPGSWVQVGED